MHIVTIKPETVFQAMADETRLRIIRLMVVSGEETCLCELVDSLNEPQTKLSRHLKVLRQAGLLSAQKEGRWIYHRLVTNVGYFEHLYQSVKAIPDELSIFKKDLKRFRNRLCLRENGRCKTGITDNDMKKDAMK
ncbi:MAG TPA: metalloregulator ArsR/SmtB family transcription factor [Gammaproteobacteria bacterium]